MGKDLDEFPVEPDASSKPDEAGDGLVCGIGGCSYRGKGAIPAADLGRHRFQKHGIRSVKGKGKARKAKPRSSTPSGPRVPAGVRAVRESLAETATKAGALIMPIMPLPGAYLVDTGEDMAEVVSRLASRNDKLLEALSKSSDVMDYLALGTWVAGLVVAAGVNLGRINLDSPVAAVYGMPAMVERLGLTTEAQGAAEDTHGMGDVGPAGAPVGDGEGRAQEPVAAGGSLLDHRPD